MPLLPLRQVHHHQGQSNYSVIKRGAKEQILKLTFTFDLVFELLREEDEKKKLGRPYGLKFEKFEKWITLKDMKEEEELLSWRDELSVRINQRGFH